MTKNKDGNIPTDWPTGPGPLTPEGKPAEVIRDVGFSEITSNLTTESYRRYREMPKYVTFSKEFMDALEKTRFMREWKNEQKHAKYQPLRGKFVHSHKGKSLRPHRQRKTLKPSGLKGVVLDD